MSKESIRLKNAKKGLWERCVITRTRYDMDKYTQCKNKLRALTRGLRKDFEKKLACNIKRNPKSFWRYTKSRLKTKEIIPTLTRQDGTNAKTAQEKADTLNEFFVSVFTREDKENIQIPTNRLIEDSLETIQITPDLVCKRLKRLSPEKSPGHGNWHPYYLREIADVFCIPLSFLFNKSLKEGAHESWLKAIITAIYKKGARSDPGNYRPISLTSVISKVMESLIRDELLIHLVRHEVLSDCQHGFVPS